MKRLWLLGVAVAFAVMPAAPATAKSAPRVCVSLQNWADAGSDEFNSAESRADMRRLSKTANASGDVKVATHVRRLRAAYFTMYGYRDDTKSAEWTAAAKRLARNATWMETYCKKHGMDIDFGRYESKK